MDFEKRLERAVERGKQSRDATRHKQLEAALTAEELRNLHSKCRLELSEHVEQCLKRLADHFPGFQYQSVIAEEGWGGKINRDDVGRTETGTANFYSRLEMVIRGFSPAHIVELSAKGTIRNREVFARNHFQFLNQVDLDSFRELIDLWVLEYAEQFSARQ